jgi:hypothetical protein
MEAVSVQKQDNKKHERIPVIGEWRISTSDQCPHCGSRRKTLVNGLGWICTTCFDQCKEEAEKVVEVGSGVSQMRQAYQLAISSYRETHKLPVRP